MAKYEAGLHKDVAVIFEGVWIPQIDNLQQSIAVSVPVNAEYNHPRPLALESWETSKNFRTRRFSSITDFFKLLPLVPSKRKREKKRLAEISKNLLINIQN